MNNVTLQIVIEGLIALVPLHEGPDRIMGNRMAALVVDATQEPAEMAKSIDAEIAAFVEQGGKRTKAVEQLAEGEKFCYQKHHSFLHFSTTARECIGNRGAFDCSYDSGECICTLDKHEISIVTNAAPPMRRMVGEKPRSLPFDNRPESAGNFAYAANFSLLGYQLDQRFVDDPQPPAALQARFKFPFDSVLACNLGLRRDERADHVHELEFRRRGVEGNVGDLSQAVAQSMIATLNLPSRDSTVILRLQRFGEAEVREFELTKGSSRIWLKNHRDALPSGHPCDDGVGRDFGLFYQLVENPPAWIDREIPHVKLTSWKSAVDIEPLGCKDTKHPISRPICPMASFNPVVSE